MAQLSRDEQSTMDQHVLESIIEDNHHGAVKYIRYYANKRVHGKSYCDYPYSESNIRSALKRLRAQGRIENAGYAHARWRYITDEMRAERDEAAKERARIDAIARDLQAFLGLGVPVVDEDGDPCDNIHVSRRHGGLWLNNDAIMALVKKLEL